MQNWLTITIISSYSDPKLTRHKLHIFFFLFVDNLTDDGWRFIVAIFVMLDQRVT